VNSLPASGWTIGIFASSEGWHSAELCRVLGDRHQLHFLDIRRLTARLAAGSSVLDCGLFPAAGPADAGRLAAAKAGAQSEPVRISGLDGVVIRAMPGGTLEETVFRMDALAELQRCGVAVINPARTVEACVDKYLSLVLLQRAGLPVPITFCGTSAREGLDFLVSCGGRAVLKPVFGSEGRGLMLLDDPDLAARVLGWLESTGQAIYLQEFVEHGHRDLRILVAGGELAAMQRVNPADWRVNAARGALAVHHEPSRDEAELAFEACRATGAMIAGVDLARDASGRLVILEINSAPGWKHLARTADGDVSAMVGRAITAAIGSIRTEAAARPGPGPGAPGLQRP
jgi:RimK family alpha-L-glutamate ligase